MTISRDVGDFGRGFERNRAALGRGRAFRVAAASGIRAKSGSFLLRRDDLARTYVPEWRAPRRPLQPELAVFCHLRIGRTRGPAG